MTVGSGFFAAAVQCGPALRLVLDGRLCGGIGVAADGLGECRFIFCAVPVLPGEVPRGIVFRGFACCLFLPPAVWGVRRGLQIARDQIERSYGPCVGLTVLTIPDVEQ